MEKELEQKFDKIDHRFDQMEEKFDKVDQRFEKMEEKFDKVDQRFEKMDQKFEDLLITVKEGFDGVSGRLDKVEGRLDNVEGELVTIKSTMATKNFVTEKLADLGAEIGKRINRSNEEQKLFSKKLVEFLKTDGVLKQEHVEELENMLV